MTITSQSDTIDGAECRKCAQSREIINGLNNEIALLRESEQVNKETLQATSDLLHAIPTGLLICQYQPPGELFYFGGNPRGHKLLGVSPDKDRGLELDELWPSARRQGLTEALLNTAKTGATFETENVHFQRGDIQRVFNLRALRIAQTLLIVALEDISSRMAPGRMSAVPESEPTIELGREHLTGADFWSGTSKRGPELNEPAEIPINELSNDDTLPSGDLGELNELLNDMRYVAHRALTRLEAGYLSTAGASVEQLLHDLERAAHVVSRLKEARLSQLEEF
jgi:hypothetical protein